MLFETWLNADGVTDALIVRFTCGASDGDGVRSGDSGDHTGVEKV